MNIRSHFAPRARRCDLAEPPSLAPSLRSHWKSALRVALLASVSVVGASNAAHAQNVQVRTTRGLVNAKAGELLVKFGAGTPPSLAAIRSNIASVRTKAAPINNRIGATELQSFGSIGWQLVKLPQGMSLEEGIKFYESQPGVADVEPNALRYMKALPNDPAYSQQYGLEKIGAPAAWNKSTGSNNTIVAVIDSGVNYTHEDLFPNMWKNPKEVVNGKDDDGNGWVDDVYGVDTGDHDSDPMDANHHGTHCAGIIGAAGNNGIGISGVNWNVKVMACKVLNSQGGIPTASIIEAMQYVVTMKARGNNIRVVNESLGGPSYVQAEKDAMDALGNAGILVAAAAGNETTNNDAKPSYPASYDCPNVISVAASDSHDDIASFSNYGATSVDLAAPGVDIYSTFWPGNSAYSNLSGTSMATPMVAGAAALLSSFSTGQDAVTLKKLLMDTVDPLPQWDGKVVTGGRMNLARALAAIDPNGLPVVTSTSPRGVASNLRPAVVVNFSKPMNPASVQANWSFAPAVTGTFAWSNNNTTVTFTPNVNLVAGTMYEGCIKGTALSAAGIKLDGDTSGTSTGSPDDDYRWNFRIVGNPSNDNFARAMPLSGDSGYVPAFNTGATREPGEGDHNNYRGPGDKSVWFKWTAPVTGNLIFDTTGSTFSHVIAVYSGSTLTSLTPEKYGDSEYVGREVLIELRVQAGTTYYIAIDGDFYPATETTPPFTDTGNIRLAWQLHRSPANDNYASAQNISGTTGSATGNTLGSYWENGETSHIGSDSSVWFRWTAPANGAAIFSTQGFDTALSVFTGTPIGSAKLVAQDANGGGAGGASLMPFTVSAGTTYYISVGGAGYAFYDARGDFKLNWSFVTAPTNDAFSAPIALNPVTGGTLTTSTYGARLEANEPEVDYDEGIASIWYTWTAPSNGAVTFDTLGSGFDTNLGAFTGSSLSGLIKVDENDDNKSIEDEATSKIKFTAIRGTTYRIRIDSPAYASSEASIGYPATHGPVRLTWSFTAAPSNDNFASAQVLTTLNGGLIGSNVGANLEAEEYNPTYHDDSSSIWYKWTAPMDGAITFDTAGSVRVNGDPMDTFLSVYDGTMLAGLEEEGVAENNDDESNAPTETSRVRFTVRAGTTYYIRLDNDAVTYGDSAQIYDARHGSIALSWNFVGAPSNDKFASATDLGSANSGLVSGTTYGAGLEANEENPTYRDSSASVWYRWTAPASGNVTFSTAGSKNLRGEAYDTQLDVYTGNRIDQLEWQQTGYDDGSSPTSKIVMEVEAGQTYFIRADGTGAHNYDSVIGFDECHGIMNLSWSLNGSPVNGPTINSFTPTSGKDGTAVTINGANLGTTNKVWFDGLAATINSVSATSVSVTAPANVRTGRISLKTGTGSAVSAADFKVVPTITSFSPASGPAGTVVTIEGSGFQGVTNVTIGGATASFTIVSGTRLTAIVPANANSGKITLTTAGGTATSAGVYSMPPRIDSFTPGTGVVGTRIQIKGANFLGTTSVLFNTTAALNPTITSEMISVAVPPNATTGLISIVTPAGTVKTATNFVVQTPPVVTGFTPAGGKAGTVVTISGANFLGATEVRFNGVLATNPTINATSIVASVPTTASTGPISVTTPDGEARSAANFIVDGEAPTISITSPVQGSSITSLPRTFAGAVNDNSGIANVQSLTWSLARAVGTGVQYWNATNSTWGTTIVWNASTPVRPSTYTTWASAGYLPTGTNLPVGAYTVRANAMDKFGNSSTASSTFTVVPITYSISGRITKGTAGLANVAVTRTGNVKVLTNANGDFSFTGISANTSITLTPALAGHVFNPVSRTVNVTSANIVGQNFAATSTAPTITSFTPVSGPVGISVTINGTNFSTATAVKFNNVAAAIKAKTATQIVAVVPTGATTGRISVTNPTGTVLSAANFTVTIPAPTIASFSPASGPVGTAVMITGTNFSTATAVKFNGVAAVIRAKTATQIATNVPAGAITGRISVTSPTGTATSAGVFTVTIPAPTIASFTPATGPVGTAVMINGTNFSTATAVKFNGVAAVIRAKTATQIATNVPVGATTGRINVTSPTGTATSAVVFTVTIPAPTIASFTPVSGPVGTSVTINGTNLSTVTSVKFNGSAAVIRGKTATQIVAVVPTGATTGRISVTSANGTATSAANFTVTTSFKGASASDSDATASGDGPSAGAS